MISEDEERLNKLLINSTFNNGMEFDEEINDDWLTLKSLSFSDQDFLFQKQN